jgi:RNA polymerase sigma-70 factor (ECF subfamily)
MQGTEDDEPVSFDRFRDYLYFLARTTLDPRLARRMDPSDVVQEALLRAHEKRSSLRGTSDAQVAVWLRRILGRCLSNLARDHFRDKRDVRRDVSLDECLDKSSARLAALGAASARPSARLSTEERALWVASLIARLPREQCEALTLKYWHEWTLEEIATHQGTSTSAVAGLLHRALKTLRSDAA